MTEKFSHGHPARMGSLHAPVTAHDAKGTLRRLLAVAGSERKALALVLLFSGLASLTASLSPLAIGSAVAAVASGTPRLTPVWLLLALYAGDAALRSFQHFLMAQAAQNVVFRLRTALFDAMKDLPLAYFDRHTHGELMSRLANDADAVSTTISTSAAMLCTQFLSLAGIAAAMLWLSVPLSVVSLAGAAGVTLLVRSITARTRPLFAQRQKILGELNGHIEETVSGAAVVRAFGREEAMQRRFAELNERLRASATRAGVWSGCLMPSASVISNVSYLALAVLGGILAARGAIGIGLVTSFLLYCRQFTRPFIGIANVYSDFQAALAGAERIFATLDETPEAADSPVAVSLRDVRGTVEFRHVTFGYTPSVPVLKDISLTVPADARVALVGETGAGKTTLTSLLLRFYDPADGAVLIDGHDLRDCTRESLRKVFSVVPQDAGLMAATVRENIAYARPDASNGQIRAAARAAGALDFIERLPNGFDTRIGQGGVELSQGQTQLLNIARALLADRPIVILDEATSSVDTVTERRVHAAMRSAMRGKTAFVIAHRLSTVRDCNLIVVLDHGRIAEKGTHEELLARDGIYAALYRAQTCEV